MFVEFVVLPVGIGVGGIEFARLTGAAVLLAALSVIGFRRLNLVLIGSAVIAELIVSHSRGSPLLIVAAALRFLFLSYVLGVVMWQVLRERDVTWDTVAGAAGAYLLIAVVWGVLYQLIERMAPGSFVVAEALRIGPSRDPSAALSYFSLGTMTTMTFGDIRPGTLAIGCLCMSETVVGQLYLAIMIARMVGARLARTAPASRP